MLFLDKIEKGFIYVLGTKVHRDDEEYYIQLLEEGRKKEAILYGEHNQDWEQQKHIVTGKQKKKLEQELNQLEIYWALEKAKDYTQLETCPF